MIDGRRLILILLVALAGTSLAGCANDANRRFVYALAADSPELAGTRMERIYVATTREKANDPQVMFNGERSDTVAHARIDVSIPPGHKTGQVERPGTGKADPRKHFVGYDPAFYDSDAAFLAAINAELDRRKPAERNVFVYVHGFNNSFDGAALRFAQIVNDSAYPGVPVLFTWASRGQSLGYIYDKDSATAARDGLERTLRLLARSHAKRIDILAHSMGTWLTMETLRQLHIGGDATTEKRINGVILASPDINLDVFKTQIERLPPPRPPIYVMISRDDRALALSRRISGGAERVGDVKDDLELASLGLTVIDLSDVDAAGDATRHSKYAANPELVRLLGNREQARQLLAGARSDTVSQDGDLGSDVGRNVTNVVSGVAGLVIVTPLKIVTAPLTAAAGE